MKYFVTLLKPSALNKDELIEACGSFANRVLDARFKYSTLVKTSHEILNREKKFNNSYCGFRLFKGESFSNNHLLHEYREGN